jgi:hypothetical protein
VTIAIFPFKDDGFQLALISPDVLLQVRIRAVFAGVNVQGSGNLLRRIQLPKLLVDLIGIEPMTSSMPFKITIL